MPSAMLAATNSTCRSPSEHASVPCTAAAAAAKSTAATRRSRNGSHRTSTATCRKSSRSSQPWCEISSSAAASAGSQPFAHARIASARSSKHVVRRGVVRQRSVGFHRQSGGGQYRRCLGNSVCETVAFGPAADAREHSDESDRPVRGFRSPGVGGRVAADGGRFVPRLLTSFVFWWVVCHRRSMASSTAGQRLGRGSQAEVGQVAAQTLAGGGFGAARSSGRGHGARAADTVRNSRRVGLRSGRGPCIDCSWTRDSPPVFPSVMPEALSDSGRGCDMPTALAQYVAGQPP